MKLQHALVELARGVITLSLSAGRTVSDADTARAAEELIEAYRIAVDELGLYHGAEA